MTTTPRADDRVQGESRWPMALAVLLSGVLHALLPDQIVIGPQFLYLACVSVLLIALVLGDPGRIDRDSRLLRWLTGLLIAFMTLANIIAGIRIVVGILSEQSFWNSASELLLSGGVVWATNVITFALWYWDLDGGGAAARARGTGGEPAFVFPEMTHTDHVREGWYPTFVDYLAFSFNTATAFSPTDVSAVKPWAKLLMVIEAMLSLGLGALVIARAVNVMT